MGHWTERILLPRLWLYWAGLINWTALATCPVLSPQTVLPTESSFLIISSGFVEPVDNCTVLVTGTDSVSRNITARVQNGALVLVLPAQAVASPGVLVLQTIQYGSSRRSAVPVYDIPLITEMARPNFTTSGVLPAALLLNPGSPDFPTATGLLVRVACSEVSGRSRDDTLAAISNGTIFWNTLDASLSSDGRALEFRTESLPAVSCAYADVIVSYNYGANWHFALSDIPVVHVPPVKAVAVYSSALQDVVWPQTLNRARILVATRLASAVDSSVFYESAYDESVVGTGKDVASIAIARAVAVNNAKLLLMGGGEFKPAVRWSAPQYPNVNFLIISSLWNDLSWWGLPNVRAITGRMYEAVFYLGYVAAATSYSGHLGLVLTLDHPTCYAMANSFALGARAAASDGVRRRGAPPVRISAWTLGVFDDLYAENTAADDLLLRGVDTLLLFSDNNDKVRRRIFESTNTTVFGLGFYADGRIVGGDRVLLSALYSFDKLVEDAVERTLAGSPFTTGPNDAGLGIGVDISSVSPLVPLEAQRAMSRRVSASILTDEVEEVFCGSIEDSRGVKRLDGETGATASGMRSSVRGEGGEFCLSSQDIREMNWVLPEVKLPPEGVSCASPPVYLSPDPAVAAAACFLWAPPPLKPLPWFVTYNLIVALVSLLVGLTLVLAIAASIGVTVFRRSLNHSSPSFLYLVNIGAVLYAGALLTFYLQPLDLTNSVCYLRLWLQGIGFALLFGTLFAKAHRVNLLFNVNVLRNAKYSDWWVLRLIGVVLAAEAVVLIILTFTLPCQVSIHTDVSAAVRFAVCSSNPIANDGSSVDVITVLTSLHVALLAWGAYLSFRTRHVTASFNESLWVGLSIYNVLACEILGFILGSLQTVTASMQHYTALVRLGFPPFATLVLLYLPKFVAIRQQVLDQRRAALKGLEPGVNVDVVSARGQLPGELADPSLRRSGSGSLRFSSFGGGRVQPLPSLMRSPLQPISPSSLVSVPSSSAQISNLPNQRSDDLDESASSPSGSYRLTSPSDQGSVRQPRNISTNIAV